MRTEHRVSTLNKCLDGDLTARAVIRDRALALFARHGPDAVTIRQIAAAAEVSPALVLHHYGSKQGLRDAVDDHVAALFDTMLTSVTEDPAPLTDGGPQALAGFAELMRTHLPEDSTVPAYLRRLLLSGDAAGRALFRRVFDMSAAMIDELVAAGRHAAHGRPSGPGRVSHDQRPRGRPVPRPPRRGAGRRPT